MALELPHLVLVEALTDVCRGLPRAAEGGTMTKADVFKKLPAVFTAWHDLRLAPVLRNQSGGGARSLRESRTLVEIADALITGDQLQGLMLTLGRLKAITEVANPTSSGWAVARHHEITAPDGVGLLSARDRQNAARDQREELRISTGRSAPAVVAPKRGARDRS